ncbi:MULTISPECIES: metalloregulator ArsR/SmtB family transcription factor [Shewanella]|uniref:Metalloregulator ArsR/SmtB family transcription factor n=1 Tax=Shewanella marisflavi TaxID=260364 RepID=A0ABX5WIE1_9GAMM|nr:MULTISPECIES: metalloregulator ArsR/SmtB family transcription factor [Shewanella]QDF74017.1 metalloregulator ArsR/SmtB family transcription factor [Shewanella marisflavi]
MAVAIFKALSDETRLLSLLLIKAEGELCVCELMAALDESQPKVSRHLAQLRKAELLSDRRQGQWVFYRINPELPVWAAEVIERTQAGNPELLDQAKARLGEMGQRPERVQVCCKG